MLGNIFALRVSFGALADAVFARLGDVGLGRGIDCRQPVEHAPHSRGQCLVGQVHVGEQRVAAKGRHLARDQHRAHRRAFEIGGIGVPEPAEIDLFVFQLDDWSDLGKSVDPFDERVFDHLAEAPRKT